MLNRLELWANQTSSEGRGMEEFHHMAPEVGHLVQDFALNLQVCTKSEQCQD